MVNTISGYKFHFSKETKNWRKGKTPQCFEIRANPQDNDLCVITCLDEYPKRSSSWWEKGQNQLLLSLLRPHREIQLYSLLGG